MPQRADCHVSSSLCCGDPILHRKRGWRASSHACWQAHVDEADVAAAEKLSEMLGGLALAIDITAHQIFVKNKSMQQFLPYFIKNKQSLRIPPRYAVRNPYYNETLVTVWQTPFNRLDENSSKLLGLICFYAPDDIPREIINRSTSIPETWLFLTDTDEYANPSLTYVSLTVQTRYEEAEAQLLHTALIKINDDTGMISIHRLIQENISIT